MTLSDPRPALAEHSSLIGYLMGVAAAAEAIEALAADPRRQSRGTADDFVHMLVGVAGMGRSIHTLASVDPVVDRPASPEPTRWLR